MELTSLNKENRSRSSSINSKIKNELSEADKSFEDFSVTYLDIVFTFISVVVRFVSVIFYFKVAFEYYQSEQFDYYLWTVLCVLVPALITIGLSVTMYLDDLHERNINYKKLVISVMILPFFFRYFDSLKYAVLCKQAERRNNKIDQKRFFDKLVKEDSDVALVRIFECFLEAAPQKILQISIIIRQTQGITWFQVYAVLAALSSMTWALASYHRCIRFSQLDKRNISWYGTIAQICWHFCVTLSRVIAIVIVSSEFLEWTLVALLCHVAVMCLWVFCFDRSPFCSQTKVHSVAFSLILGFVFIFTYILPKEGNTFYRYLFFYSVCFVENVICVVLFYFYVPVASYDQEGIYFYIHYLLLTTPVVAFLVGIVCMIFYYKFLHPNILSLSD